MSELPLLVVPKPKEELIVYMSASYGAVSAVLMTERGAVTEVERHARRTQYHIPPEDVGERTDIGRLSRREAIRQFARHISCKNPAGAVDTITDGSSCIDGSGVGLILTSPKGTEFTYALRFQFTASNNEAEYEALIARLGKGNKNWVEELPHVLWAHRTMIKSSHGDTPFSLTYGTEAVILAKIGMPPYRIATVDAVHNNEELRLNLDLLEEKRERAAICEAKAKRKMTKYYNARFRDVTFRPGDFVYRRNDASHAVAGGKLGPKWE
ncbi:reverse transcriptase domain-containing protein [Tanacetum coccineum]